MSPHKKVATLLTLTSNIITGAMIDICYLIIQEPPDIGRLIAGIEALLSEIPEHLMEDLVTNVISHLIAQRRKLINFQYYDFPSLGVALQVLLRHNIRKLDLGDLCRTGLECRIDSKNVPCSSPVLLTSLAKLSKLTTLVLTENCRDDILQILGTNCPLITELCISKSPVTDIGLAYLVPKAIKSENVNETPGMEKEYGAHRGCPLIIILDILSCFSVTPAGAEFLLRGLTHLKKILYCRMSQLIQLSPSVKPIDKSFQKIEYFQSNVMRPFNTPLSVSQIQETFPNLTSINIYISDIELRNLVFLPQIVQLELTLSDDPGPGLIDLLEHHCNNKYFQHLTLYVGNMNANHLICIAKTCNNLAFLRIVADDIDNPDILTAAYHYFTTLTELHLRLNIGEMIDSDIEDENARLLCNSNEEHDEESELYEDESASDWDTSSDEDENTYTKWHSPNIIEFFLRSGAINLQVVNITMNLYHFLNNNYLITHFLHSPMNNLARCG